MPRTHPPQRQPGAKTSIHVERTPGQCMASLLDIHGWPRWRTGLLHIGHASDEPVLTASSWVEAWRLGLKTLRMGARIVEVQSPTTFAYVASGDGLSTRTAWHLRPSAGGTHLTQTLHAEATGLLGWWADLPKAWLDHNRHSFERLPAFLQGQEALEAAR